MIPFQFTHPWWLLALVPAWAWTAWLFWKSDAPIEGWRRWTAGTLRFAITTAVVLALAGLQWRRPVEGVNVFFILDRSDSVPGTQQEAARELVNALAAPRRPEDRGGVVVFGAEAAIEFNASHAVDLPKVQAVVPTTGSDLGAAVRLATAALPELGQKRLVLLSDGNETVGDAFGAAVAARSLGASLDVIPLGASRGADVRVQKLALPNQLKKGQTMDVKLFVEAEQATQGTLSLYRNDQLIGTQPVELAQGKNLFSFPQTLADAGFYTYDVRLDVPGDVLVQNNRASGFTAVRGDPRVLIVSSDPPADAPLAQALRESRLEVAVTDVNGMPATLAEMQNYEAILLANVAAGDLSPELMRRLQSAVRDFGVGLVALGGDQAFAAGGYRGTPLEEALPVDMELSSRKILPRGALVLVVHATEFPNGNRWARDIAFAALEALGPQDEMGIVLWDGTDRWLFPLSPVGDKREKGRAIMGMNPGDMPAFQNVMTLAHGALQQSTANLKHMVVFSDGDPAAPSDALMQQIVGARITLSAVMIGGHVAPETMIKMSTAGRGRFYDVRSPGQLPQIFVKEAAVVLKSAIVEQPFRPQVAGASEVTRGFGAGDYPLLRGYVATSTKARAETPLLTEQGDPLLAHWQYGLGRAVAFTSDARAKWAADWLGWERNRQFWTQVVQWSLRKVDASDFTTDVSLENGRGTLSVEALDADGNFRNFLNLQAAVVAPDGRRETVRLGQKGPGRYEAVFDGRQVGTYMLNLVDLEDGRPRASQVIGASVNYSPEFNASQPNLSLLLRLAEATGGKLLDPAVPADNPFLRDRRRTHQPQDLWWWLLAAAIVLFPLDVGVRRVQLDREELRRAWAWLRAKLPAAKSMPAPAPTDEKLATLLARKESVRTTTTKPAAPSPELFQPDGPVPEAPPATTASAPASPRDPPATPPTPETAAASTASRLLDAKRRAKGKQSP
ncbi:MAG: VWA domain-containing protein [Limisphaerales bacterium]